MIFTNGMFREMLAFRRGLFPLVVLLAAAVVAAPAPLAAQVPRAIEVSDTLQEIRLQDGSTLYGRVVAVDAERITVETTGGVRVDLERAQIRFVRPVQGRVRAGEVWPEDPNGTRLFFGPTGRMLRAGDGYAGAFELFLPFVSFGVTDHVTLAGGTPVIPHVFGRVYYLAPKVGAAISPEAHVSAGVLAFFDLTDSRSRTAGIVYTAGTFGSTDNAVTVGAGWPFFGDDLEQRPVLMFGGETRVARRVKLVTENYMISYREDRNALTFVDGELVWGPTVRQTRSIGLLSGGIRIIGERLSADAGLGVGVGMGGTGCCLPVVNFVYNFGPNR